MQLNAIIFTKFNLIFKIDFLLVFFDNAVTRNPIKKGSKTFFKMCSNKINKYNTLHDKIQTFR